MNLLHRAPPGAAPADASLGRFGRSWIVAVTLFCISRAIVVWPALLAYGVNPWWFLLLDVATAPPYALSQAMAVKVVRDPRRSMREALLWMALLLASFLTPYGYVLLTAGYLPSYVAGAVLLWMIGFASLAVWRVLTAASQPLVEPSGRGRRRGPRLG